MIGSSGRLGGIARTSIIEDMVPGPEHFGYCGLTLSKSSDHFANLIFRFAFQTLDIAFRMFNFAFWILDFANSDVQLWFLGKQVEVAELAILFLLIARECAPKIAL